MKKIHRVFAMLMAAIMALSLVTTAFAEPTIDPAKKASLSIYKYDITKASEDGVWDAESYVSTSLHDDAVVDKLSKYAIQGVEFTYLKVADVTMNWWTASVRWAYCMASTTLSAPTPCCPPSA